MPNNISGLEQGRAKFAYECALEASKKPEKIKMEYKSYVKKFPMMIKTNGLGSSLAFVYSKGKDDPTTSWGLVNNHLTEWLKKEQNRHLIAWKDKDELVKIVISMDSGDYRALTNEVLSFFNWLRRFSEGLIVGD